MSKRQGGKFDFLSDAPQRQPEPEPAEERADVRKRTPAQAHTSTSAQPAVERNSSGQRIRTDLLRAIKILAAETDRPQYLLIEEAIEAYLNKEKPGWNKSSR